MQIVLKWTKLYWDSLAGGGKSGRKWWKWQTVHTKIRLQKSTGVNERVLFMLFTHETFCQFCKYDWLRLTCHSTDSISPNSRTVSHNSPRFHLIHPLFFVSISIITSSSLFHILFLFDFDSRCFYLLQFFLNSIEFLFVFILHLQIVFTTKAN